MTIRAGEEWGRPAAGTGATSVASGDFALARLVAAGTPGPLRVTGGDLFRSLGSPSGAAARIVPIDALEVEIDGRAYVAVAHVLATAQGFVRGRRGPVVVVANAEYMGRWDIAPRAHPNDGRADVLEIAERMSPRARWELRTRLPLGTHLPHPDITTRSVRAAQFEFDRRMCVWVDGRLRVKQARTLRVVVRPDAFELCV